MAEAVPREANLGYQPPSFLPLNQNILAITNSKQNTSVGLILIPARRDGMDCPSYFQLRNEPVLAMLESVRLHMMSGSEQHVQIHLDGVQVLVCTSVYLLLIWEPK